MVNYDNNLVSVLNTILPTYYEMTLTSKTNTPCISYMELNNSVEQAGDNIEISRVIYQVKVWSNLVRDLKEYSIKIDDALRDKGFKRIASNELYDINSTMMQKVLTYEALSIEKTNKGE